jgi:hypothetical protein
MMNVQADAVDRVDARTNCAKGWARHCQQHAYYFRSISIITLATGALLHAARLLLGDDYLFQHIMTPAFDRLFLLPIAYCGASGLLAWRQIEFRSRWHKAIMAIIILYMLVSIPIHLKTYFTNSIEHMRQFPLWVSVVLQPWYIVIITLLWRTKLKRAPTHPS